MKTDRQVIGSHERGLSQLAWDVLMQVQCTDKAYCEREELCRARTFQKFLSGIQCCRSPEGQGSTPRRLNEGRKVLPPGPQPTRILSNLPFALALELPSR